MATLILALAGPAAGSHAAAPVRGATYSAQNQALTLTVSRDGRRVYGIHGSIPGSCPDENGNPAPTPVAIESGGPGDSAAVRRGGSFHYADLADIQTDVRGTFAAGGRLTGTVGYGDRGGCTGGARFTARAQPRQAGTSRRVYTLLDSGSIFVAGVTSLPGDQIVLADTATPADSRSRGFLRQIDARGRLSTLLRTGGADDLPTGVAALRDGSVVYAQASRNRIMRRARDGRVTVAAAGLASPTRVAATPDGGFVYSDGGTGGDYAQNTTVGRVRPGGAPQALARFSSVDGLAAQPDGGVLVSSGGQVQRIAPAGTVGVVAGSGVQRFSGDNGPARSAGMTPGDVAALPGGGFLFVDETVHRIRMVSASGRVTTFAGGGEIAAGVPGALAAIDPSTLAVLADGSVAFTQQGSVKILPAAHSRRLLVGLPARDAAYAALARAHRALPVALTRRARVTVTLTRGRRRLATVRRTLRAGTHQVRLPRAKVPGRGALGLRVRATGGGAAATDRLTLP